MKKKYIYFCKTIVLTIGLAVLLTLKPFTGQAQDNSQLFALVECMKVKPENDGKYVDLEKNIWKPLHQERANKGNIFGWFLYKVRFTGTDDKYNYVTVTLFSDPQNIENPWKDIDAEKILPGKDLDKAMAETGESRDMVSSSLIYRNDFVYPAGGPGNFKYIQLDYMKVQPGKDGEYLDAEINVWKSVHNEFIKAGSRVGWSLWSNVYPSGYARDYQYITVNYFSDWSKIGTANYMEAFNKAHPGKDTDALMQKTDATRVLVRSELWEVIDGAFPKQ